MAYSNLKAKDERRKTAYRKEWANISSLAFVLRPTKRSFIPFDSKKKASKKPDPGSG